MGNGVRGMTETLLLSDITLGTDTESVTSDWLPGLCCLDWTGSLGSYVSVCLGLVNSVRWSLGEQ